jgi:hypothetical protein
MGWSSFGNKQQKRVLSWRARRTCVATWVALGISASTAAELLDSQSACSVALTSKVDSAISAGIGGTLAGGGATETRSNGGGDGGGDGGVGAPVLGDEVGGLVGDLVGTNVSLVASTCNLHFTNPQTHRPSV